MTPVVLSIAGSDCSAGAGIQADLKTIAHLGGYGLSAVTAVVSEAPGKVSRIELMSGGMIADQMRVLGAAFPIAAAKTGMLGGAEQTAAVVAGWLESYSGQIPLVVDPVMVATSGDPLMNVAARELMVAELFPLATVITPNMDEAAVLWGRPLQRRADLQACAEQLAERYVTAVLVKGGHLQGDVAADCLAMPGTEPVWFESTRVSGISTHGTGCSYSAAIATALAAGMGLPEAVRRAKLFIAQAIAQSHVWGGPSGPVHALRHFPL
jgi:hydroxymethylpyrimidine/phosphomethylpyrimidine kinase